MKRQELHLSMAGNFYGHFVEHRKNEVIYGFDEQKGGMWKEGSHDLTIERWLLYN